MLTEQISSLRDYDTAIRKRKAGIKEGIDLLDEALTAEGISDVNLRLLVDEIEIGEKNGKLHITVRMKANFRRHLDLYDKNGKLTESFFEMKEVKPGSEKYRQMSNLAAEYAEEEKSADA